MPMIRYHPRPSYYVTERYVRRGPAAFERVPGGFSIYELRGGVSTHICDLSNRGPDRLNNILKRGIPLDDARRIFYEMDE